MKTWTFVTAVFWLFYGLCVCPQSPEQTTGHQECIGDQTTVMDALSPNWNSPDIIRPPPRAAWDQHDLTQRDITVISVTSQQAISFPLMAFFFCARAEDNGTGESDLCPFLTCAFPFTICRCSRVSSHSMSEIGRQSVRRFVRPVIDRRGVSLRGAERRSNLAPIGRGRAEYDSGKVDR
jgi:hypothetical protein